jgi:hypothetical protein
LELHTVVGARKDHMASVVFAPGDIFERGADLTVLPCSAKAHISRTAEKHVDRYGLDRPPEIPLGQIHVVPFPGAGRDTRHLAWAASVMNYTSTADIIRSIGSHLGAYANEHADVAILESPLLGTGRGALDPYVAGLALKEGFESTCTTDAVLFIYGQLTAVIEELRRRSAPSMAATTNTPRRPYQVALSFAGEDRGLAAKVASGLRAAGVSVFYDEFEDLWGENLADHLARVYGQESDYVVIFVSAHYVKKEWPNHEREHALAARLQRAAGTVLPVRLDHTALPGLPSTVHYVRASDVSPEELVRRITAKVQSVRA